jgi:hypothetical protein
MLCGENRIYSGSYRIRPCNRPARYCYERPVHGLTRRGVVCPACAKRLKREYWKVRIHECANQSSTQET